MRENKDLRQLIGIFVAGLIGLLVIIFVIASFVSMMNQEVGVDETSGETVNTYTGTVTKNISVIGIQVVQERGFSADAFSQMVDWLQKYVTTMYPKAERISYVKDSLKVESPKYSFSIKLNTGEEFKIDTEDKGKLDFTIKISNKSGELYSYDSTIVESPKNSKYTLISNMLPYEGKLDSGREFTVSYDSVNGKYLIEVSSCGNSAVKNDALVATRNWLEKINYEPNDFTFEIPDLCME